MTPLEKLFANHDAALEALTASQQRALLKVLVEHRRIALLQIRQTPSLSVGSVPYELSRLNPVILALQRALGLSMAQAESLALDQALDHVGALWFLQRGSYVGLDEMQVRVAGVLADYKALALWDPSIQGLTSLVKTQIQGQIVAGAIQGETGHAVAKRILQVAPIQDHRAALIAQMEMNRAYSEVATEVAKERGWLRRIVEVNDSRNHPFSRASHGKMAEPGRNFKVLVAEVAAAEASLGKKATGVLWRKAGSFYVGANLPAHFGERGRVVPWDPGWSA